MKYTGVILLVANLGLIIWYVVFAIFSPEKKSPEKNFCFQIGIVVLLGAIALLASWDFHNSIEIWKEYKTELVSTKKVVGMESPLELSGKGSLPIYISLKDDNYELFVECEDGGYNRKSVYVDHCVIYEQEEQDKGIPRIEEWEEISITTTTRKTLHFFPFPLEGESSETDRRICKTLYKIYVPKGTVAI